MCHAPQHDVSRASAQHFIFKCDEVAADSPVCSVSVSPDGVLQLAWTHPGACVGHVTQPGDIWKTRR